LYEKRLDSREEVATGESKREDLYNIVSIDRILFFFWGEGGKGKVFLIDDTEIVLFFKSSQKISMQVILPKRKKIQQKQSFIKTVFENESF